MLSVHREFPLNRPGSGRALGVILGGQKHAPERFRFRDCIVRLVTQLASYRYDMLSAFDVAN
jgi:hypothetical protein